MTEIWSLHALCRCCHADGEFKDLRLEYMQDNTAENYLNMLLETLGVTIKPPPVNASYAICDDCISQLRHATNFKKKVLECETKFEEYCKNELSLNYDIKAEPEYLDDPDNDLGEWSGKSTQEWAYNCCNSKVFGDDIEVKDSFNKNKNEVFNISIKKPIKIKNIKKEVDSNHIEISIDVKPKLEGKSTKKRNRLHAKGKTSKKPKEEESLVVKVKTETGELYSCKNCGASYDTLEQLNGHINMEHFKGFKCLYCDEQFQSELQYKIHNRLKHNDSKPFPCDHCGKKMSARLSLNEHVNSVHTKEIFYQCDVCQKKFHNKQVLRIHIRKHYGTFRKLICEQCGVGCNDRTNLRYHVMTVHEKLKLFQCNECDKKFSAAKHLKVHIRSHTGERPFECDICHHAFASKDNLTVHKKIHTDSGYTCKSCSKVFPTRGLYTSHYRKHVGSKPFKCHLCNKEFAGKYSLNRHLFEHTGARPFMCPICGKDFKQKIQLVRHNRRFHDPHKPEVIKEKCDLCKRTVPNIEKHMKAHLNKPFACHLCEKRYPLQNALNRHLQRHTGIKPHQCDLCDKGYIQLKTLKAHRMRVHKLPLKTEQEDHYDSIVNTYTIQNLKRK